MPAVTLDATTDGRTHAIIIKASTQEYVNRITIVPKSTVNALTNIATLVDRPSCTIWVSEPSLESKSPVRMLS